MQPWPSPVTWVLHAAEVCKADGASRGTGSPCHGWPRRGRGRGHLQDTQPVGQTAPGGALGRSWDRAGPTLKGACA